MLMMVIMMVIAVMMVGFCHGGNMLASYCDADDADGDGGDADGGDGGDDDEGDLCVGQQQRRHAQLITGESQGGPLRQNPL